MRPGALEVPHKEPRAQMLTVRRSIVYDAKLGSRIHALGIPFCREPSVVFDYTVNCDELSELEENA